MSSGEASIGERMEHCRLGEPALRQVEHPRPVDWAFLVRKSFEIATTALKSGDESNQQEFDKYHWLIERLIQPNEKGQVFLDKQIAVVFELRHFPRYYECTERILSGLRTDWNMPEKYSRLLSEIDLTLQYIRGKK